MAMRFQRKAAGRCKGERELQEEERLRLQKRGLLLEGAVEIFSGGRAFVWFFFEVGRGVGERFSF